MEKCRRCSVILFKLVRQSCRADT